MLALTGQICSIIGALIYKQFFRAVDTRTMIFAATLIQILGAFCDFSFAKRWNLEFEIDDMFFLFFTEVIFDCIHTLLFTLPIMALFAKITPKNIEGTTFATLTGTMNFASTVIKPGIGVFINQ